MLASQLEPDLTLPSIIPSNSDNRDCIIIQRRSGWRLIDWKELYAYRDLFYFMVWRSIKVRYSQSAIGIGWAIIQPVFSMLMFTIVFGRLARVSSDGAPYSVFSFVALIPWTYFSNALTDSTGSLVNNAAMLNKVYFPRMVLPLAAATAKLMDFAIGMLVLAALLAWHRISPTPGALMLPALTLLMVVSAAGLGMWLTALAVQYRDVNYGISFGVQLMMYASPIVYPTSLISHRFQLLYALNPMVGVIEGFRAALLGTRPMPWDLLAVGSTTALMLAVTGAIFFRSREKVFADVA